MTIREIPERALEPDSSAEKPGWHEHEPSACIPLGQTAIL